MWDSTIYPYIVVRGRPWACAQHGQERRSIVAGPGRAVGRGAFSKQQAAIITVLAIATCLLYRCWRRARRTSSGGKGANKARGRYATLQQQYVGAGDFGGGARGRRRFTNVRRALRVV